MQSRIRDRARFALLLTNYRAGSRHFTPADKYLKALDQSNVELVSPTFSVLFNPPICPVNGSAYPGIESTSDYIIRVIDSPQKDRLRSVFQQKVIVPWPGTILHYYAATEIVRWENYDLKFEQDDQKFASFGNGITEEGFTPKSIPWL
ncbi:hypothetical protein IWW34DRAFT_824909 [Fusarium oxysporum f. sp. albedinis]|nr:hypothetical protein IWW34DRAFT_824909 [Fusarium oxysporum f. sp. albedinis]